MKKLVFIFAVLLAVVLVSGCGARQNTIRYNNGADISADTEVKEDSADTGEDVAEDAEADAEEMTEDTEEDTEMTEETEEAQDTQSTAKTTTPTGKLSVTSFDGGYLKTNLSYNVVKGTAPSDTKKITINDYRLSKYIGGQTQWDYIASTRFNTLKDGTNTYVVKSYNADGEQTDSVIFTIEYTAPAVPVSLPDVGSNHWLILLASLFLTGSYTIARKHKWL